MRWFFFFLGGGGLKTVKPGSNSRFVSYSLGKHGQSLNYLKYPYFMKIFYANSQHNTQYIVHITGNTTVDM